MVERVVSLLSLSGILWLAAAIVVNAGLPATAFSSSSSSAVTTTTSRLQRDRRRHQERRRFDLFLASNANEMMPLTKGSICAVITPMKASGDIDIVEWKRLLQFHLEAGTDGLCILGTTGESSVLTMSERETIIKTAVELVKGRIPILVGTGATNPITVKELTLQAKDLGCDASLVVTPMYVKPPQRCLISHFVQVASFGLPVVIYNVPSRTGVDMKPETIVHCASAHENIVGVKEATGDLTRLNTLLLDSNLLLYSGDDETQAEFVLRGGHGSISVTANLVPTAIHHLIQAALAGDRTTVERINGPLSLLHSRLFCETNPIPVKWAAQRIGRLTSSYCRAPLDELDPKFHVLVEEALQVAGLI